MLRARSTEGLPGYANTLGTSDGGGLCLLGETRGLRESKPVCLDWNPSKSQATVREVGVGRGVADSGALIPVHSMCILLPLPLAPFPEIGSK